MDNNIRIDILIFRENNRPKYILSIVMRTLDSDSYTVLGSPVLRPSTRCIRTKTWSLYSVTGDIRLGSHEPGNYAEVEKTAVPGSSFSLSVMDTRTGSLNSVRGNIRPRSVLFSQDSGSITRVPIQC